MPEQEDPRRPKLLFDMESQYSRTPEAKRTRIYIKHLEGIIQNLRESCEILKKIDAEKLEDIARLERDMDELRKKNSHLLYQASLREKARARGDRIF